MENIWLVAYYFFFLMSVLITGEIVLRYLKLRFRPSIWLIHAFALGCIAQAYWFFLLGVLGLITPITVASGYLLPVVLFLFTVTTTPAYREKIAGSFQENLRAVSAAVVWPWLVIGIFILPLVGYAFLYPVSWDAVAYHLMLPKFYLSAHSLEFVSWFPQTAFPPGIHTLFAYGEILADPRFSGLLTITFIAGIPLAIIYNLRQDIGEKPALLAAFLSLCIPLLYSETGFAPGVDYQLALIGLLSVITFADYLIKPSRRSFSLALAYVGFAGLVKVSGLFIGISLLITWLVVALHALWSKKPKRWSELRQSISPLACLWLLPTMYWYIKTWIAAHNPVYPFLNGFFKGFDYEPAAVDLLGDDIQRLNQFVKPLLSRYRHSSDTILDTVGLADLSLITILIVGAVASLVIPHKKVRYMALMGLLSVIPIIFLVGPLQRYYLALLPVLAVVCSHTVFWLFKSRSNQPLLFLVSLACLSSMLALQIDATMIRRQELFISMPFRVWLSYFSPTVGKQRLFLQDNYEVTLYANQRLNPETHKILQLFDNRLYYLTIPAEYFNPSPGSLFRFDSPVSAQDSAKTLQAQRFTHLIVSTNWGVPPTVDPLRVTALTSSEYVEALFSHRGATLYELKMN